MWDRMNTTSHLSDVEAEGVVVVDSMKSRVDKSECRRREAREHQEKIYFCFIWSSYILFFQIPEIGKKPSGIR